MGLLYQVVLKRSTRTITLRIDAPLEEVLSRDAKAKGLTINSLTNQIFKRYVEWDRFSEGLCMLPISRDILKGVFDKLSEEESRAAGENAGYFVPRELSSLLFGGFDSESLTRLLELWFSRFTSYEHKTENSDNLFVVHHDINLNFSLYWASFLQAALKDAGCGNIKTHPSQNMLTFSFTTPK